MRFTQVKSRVLIVDDNADNRALATATLEDEGYDVVTACNGREAVAAFEAFQPDCILLDVRMPGMDGFDVCARIRSKPAGVETPIVFLTALRDIDTFERAELAGADDFLTKPVRPAELLARLQAAIKLRNVNAELSEHNEIVRRQRSAFIRLQLQKERLTTFVVHDLKNPVNSMDLHAQLLLRNPDLPDSARASVQHIRDEARSLSRLLLNLLDISKSEEGQLLPRPAEVDFAALLADAVETLQLKARCVGVSISTELALPGPIRADPDLMRRVLENLLDNAIRHAPDHSQVRVGAVMDSAKLVVRVADAGRGIDPEMRRKVFARFVQVDDDERVEIQAGRGLGLSFCQLAVEAHGGNIWIDDANPGAVFCFELPQ